MRARVALAQYRFAPLDTLDVDIAARWFSNNEHQMYHEPMGLIDRDRDGVAEWMTRQLRNQIRDNEAFTASGNAVWRINTGRIEHKVLFGADVSSSTPTSRRRPPTVPTWHAAPAGARHRSFQPGLWREHLARLQPGRPAMAQHRHPQQALRRLPAG